ncbi:succinyl-CoA--3-ketoacid-CoA transferase [Bacillus sp. FJAT-27225]|uniref:3-oxoacid CoA-transferase subunit B n=1 Tax=Bacillus sp. FJAT-27225 TaxID=1743144 RepID=UPI00080C2342|nr:3-oxoacid CoA-transferase subunit B [Bacillus sp. FJAT-27225]OCA90724.1 succinyl-CoA--3-ketoacid-CoA transferase [Bacillus sp. FJAT-27225]
MSKNIRAKERIAQRVAMELKKGQIVNLGVGIPTLIPNYLTKEQGVYLHSENGILGMGPPPSPEGTDMDCISASKHPVTLDPGASIFSSVDSFGMIRGGHIDVVVLGALQVSEKGEIANWAVPGSDILGVGGAMDLVPGAKKIIVAMTHLSKEGAPKLVKELEYPITGLKPAQMVVTELAVFTIQDGEMILIEAADGISIEDLRKKTRAAFRVSNKLKKW